MEVNTLLNTDRPKLDINDKYLPEGNYSFCIKHFGEGGNVTGIIEGTIYDNNNSTSLEKAVKKSIREEYTFKYYSVIQMMAKAQSQVARRARTVSSNRIESLDYKNIPAYPSPSNIPGLMRNVVIDTTQHFDYGNSDFGNAHYESIRGPPTPTTDQNSVQMFPDIITRTAQPLKRLMKKRKKSIAKCMICLTSSKLDKTLECGHKYHYQCIAKWFHECERTCPVCRCTIVSL